MLFYETNKLLSRLEDYKVKNNEFNDKRESLLSFLRNCGYTMISRKKVEDWFLGSKSLKFPLGTNEEIYLEIVTEFMAKLKSDFEYDVFPSKPAPFKRKR